MSDQIEAYARVGMDGYVSKPIEITELIAAIDAALSDEGASVRAA